MPVYRKRLLWSEGRMPTTTKSEERFALGGFWSDGLRPSDHYATDTTSIVGTSVGVIILDSFCIISVVDTVGFGVLISNISVMDKVGFVVGGDVVMKGLYGLDDSFKAL